MRRVAAALIAVTFLAGVAAPALAQTSAPATAPADKAKTDKAATDKPKTDKIYYKGISITMGGFAEAASIYRDHDETADISSSFSKIPFANDRAGHTGDQDPAIVEHGGRHAPAATLDHRNGPDVTRPRIDQRRIGDDPRSVLAAHDEDAAHAA